MSKTISKSTHQKSRLKVLVIDDNEQITKLISSFLGMSNHDCTITNDGREGLELIKTNQYDSIVLDLAIPEFDGYQIIDTLQTEDHSQIHKITILTASSVPNEIIQKFKGLGVSSFLQKPIDIDRLLSSITDVAD